MNLYSIYAILIYVHGDDDETWVNFDVLLNETTVYISFEPILLIFLLTNLCTVYVLYMLVFMYWIYFCALRITLKFYAYTSDLIKKDDLCDKQIHTHSIKSKYDQMRVRWNI